MMFGNEKEFEKMPQTAEEFERWAFQSNNPIVYNAIRLSLQGDATREEALLLAIWHLAKANAELQDRLYQRLVREPVTMIFPPFTEFARQAERMVEEDEYREIINPLG
jgi:hypothetical protein